jgi:hypothetical protein
MEPLYLQSEEALYFYLKKFLKAKPSATHLDGSSLSGKGGDEPTRQVIAVFNYSVTGKQYKLYGNMTRQAIEAFIKLSDEQGSPAIALKEYQGDKVTGLILANTKSPNGFHCEIFVTKAADRFKRVA